MHQIPSAILTYELTAVREIVLSGLQLELYSLSEKVFVYWYLAKVLRKHLECLDDLLSVVPRGTLSLVYPCRARLMLRFFRSDSEAHKTHKHLSFQRTFLSALQAMSLGMFRVRRSIPIPVVLLIIVPS